MNGQASVQDVRSVAELRKLRDTEIQALEAARVEIEELRRQRSAEIADASDGEITKLDAAIAAAERGRDRAAARAERIESEIAVAVEAERQLELRQRYAIVQELCYRAEFFQQHRYRELAAELAAGLELVRQADKAVARYHDWPDEIPAGAEKLRRPSDARRTPYVPARIEIVKTTRWVDAAGVPTAVQIVDGRPTAAGVHQRLVEERKEIPARGGVTAVPLYDAVADGELPHENPGAPRYWPLST